MKGHLMESRLLKIMILKPMFSEGFVARRRANRYPLGVHRAVH